ncbi:type ISP restriction/modification enzyme [Pulveribacter sp.]|uniref:DEAD/DEAH box helicase n=1 Tax=Pulveribacter sp. TaxID=2678893 RepID=UPI0028ABA467|nr:type ISP restriction/modification enzyme [Pulveribacter sp.]
MTDVDNKSPLTAILDAYRNASATEREKGTYFEELTICYLRNEATYKDLYSDVWTYAQWAELQGIPKNDAGIDLVAKTADTGEFHAIQCKLYAPTYRLQKSDIDSFFTASGKKIFSRRVIVSTTNNWSDNAENALIDQQPPVTKIDLHDLENSQIDWAKYQPNQAPVLKPKKSLRPHQQSALNATLAGFERESRGKLIMACGTGKTFTSLKIAEAYAGAGKRVLFLVPSLSLLSQTLTEWTQESTTPLHSFAVCSDSDVGKHRKKDDDVVQTFTHELRYPATTDPARLALEMGKRHDDAHMSVVFSTYHSIDTISKAQKENGLPAFDLIICDEAHRTTGATFGDDDESNFVKVHDAGFIQASKRLYMTATPRIYGNNAKASAEKDNVVLCSMDDENLYGPELYVITFSEAVRLGLLCDYKVIVLSVEESHVNRRIQELLRSADNDLRVDDAAKIIGCWKALAKQELTPDLVGDTEPMKRAVAFCQVIETKKGAKVHKVSSVNIADMFSKVVQAYQDSENLDDDELQASPAYTLQCEAEHVDGGMNASKKEEKLTWLKDEPPENTCRILSNVRCLSEGVDVPALDAVLFLTPRNSQVDVVQSVGRVMRNAPGKKRGYVVLPVVIPAGVEPHKALNDNKTYKVVWEVLQALRSHDDKFDAMVNKLELVGNDRSKIEIIAVSDKIQQKSKRKKDENGVQNKTAGRGGSTIGRKEATGPSQEEMQGELQFEVGEIEKAIYAKLVQKVGNRHHWEDWANDIAKIAHTHIDNIQAILDNPSNTEERDAFNAFANELRDDLNGSISDGEIVEMLAQHMITKPVFDALFSDYSFAQHNPMSKAMQGVLDALHQHNLDKEASTLQKFYDSVKMRAEGIDNATGKQKIVVELYDKFFRNAFPKMTERLGIVYTPVEVVDFILHSVNDLLKKEFNQTLGSKGVHIIDPFTGTGTFITRLLQSGLINQDELPYKYKQELHANEIVLLAYYIAAINIEATYHSLIGGKYVPFEGICLTDTFQMYEKDDLVDALIVDNSARRKRQKKLDIRVIVGNPPYSIGQASQNDNNSNITYPNLDRRISESYAELSSATNLRGLYDSYVRAFRWASDRIGACGIVSFVTNAGFLDSTFSDGMRKSLATEFSDIYVFHLKGLRGQKTAGERAKREGGQIFGIASAAAICIVAMVKNPAVKHSGKIHFHEIDDYLNREEKLKKIEMLGSISGISNAQGWRAIVPDSHGDWINQRNSDFVKFMPLGVKKGSEPALISTFAHGVVTGRDAWCFNASRTACSDNIQRMIGRYNSEVKNFDEKFLGLSRSAREDAVKDFIETDETEVSWTRALKQDLVRSKRHVFFQKELRRSLYRPFTKLWLYFDRELNEAVSLMPQLFPSPDVENLAIGVTASMSRNEYSVLMINGPASFHAVDMVGTQFFPLYFFDSEKNKDKKAVQQELIDFSSDKSLPDNPKHDALTDVGLTYFKDAYPSESLTKEDIFYYVYGLLHSLEYRTLFADNLGKELPRIPRVKKPVDFWAFSKAGRDLAHWHLNYETVEPYPLTIDAKGVQSDADYRVEKMKFAKKGDKSTVIYNGKITLRDIPAEAWNYVVNGKAALDWVMERQSVKTDPASGIVNDANDWAIETMGNPKYPLELFQRVVTVSLKTQKIVAALPKLDI